MPANWNSVEFNPVLSFLPFPIKGIHHENYTDQTPVPDCYAAFAETSKLVIESGDSAQSRQQAAMEKEQWNDTRQLRQKVNKRAEKEWDKADTAFDSRDKCEQSANINAYWEPNTLRCLDRRTGRTVAP